MSFLVIFANVALQIVKCGVALLELLVKLLRIRRFNFNQLCIHILIRRNKIHLGRALLQNLFLDHLTQNRHRVRARTHQAATPSAPAGSTACRECHADFYKLWATSWHGLAMQPYTAAFAHARLTPQQGEVTIGRQKYRAEIGAAAGLRRQTGSAGAVISFVIGLYVMFCALQRDKQFISSFNT